MAREDVEIVAAALEALGERDRDRVARLFAPDAEWHNTSSFPGPSVCVGPDEIVGLWTGVGEGFAAGGNEIEEIADHGGLVTVGMRSWGSGRLSGAPVEVRYAAVFELVDGRIARVRVHGSLRKALEAAGLSDDGREADD